MRSWTQYEEFTVAPGNYVHCPIPYMGAVKAENMTPNRLMLVHVYFTTQPRDHPDPAEDLDTTG